MAGSNWDTFALDANGEPTGGVAQSAEGVGIEIYKNWLYIHDPLVTGLFTDDDHKVEHFHYVGDVVMEISEGRIKYGGWQINAWRGPKDGIYVVAYHQRLNKGTHVYGDRQILVGCGLYGWERAADQYSGYIAELGLPPEAATRGSHSDSEGGSVYSLDFLLDGEFVANPETGGFNFTPPDQREPKFLGVEASDVAFLKERALEVALAGGDFPGEALRRLDFSKGLRVNQGDLRWFGARPTPVGEAEPPTLTELFRPEA